MRICLFTSANSLQGGAELCQAQIARHLIAQGHEVHVVLPHETELSAHYRDMGAHMHIMYWQNLRKLSDPLHVLKYLLLLPVLVVRLVWMLRHGRFDIMHVNEILDFQGLLAARLAGVKSVVFVRIILPGVIMRRMVAAIAMILADRVVCVSQAVRRMALGNSASPKVCVIHDGGPDCDIFNPDRTEPVRPDGVNSSMVIGMVAKLVRQKGHLLLVDMARRLSDAGRRDIHYVIVGGPVNGHQKYALELQQAVEQAGLKDRIHLVGQQRQVAGYIAGMDIVCHLPLCEDSFPGVPMEAAIMRKAVLSFISGGIPEELTHPTSARLVPIGDIDGLVANATELIDNPELRRQIGQNAREEVMQKFSLPEHLRQIDRLYADVLAKR